MWNDYGDYEQLTTENQLLELIKVGFAQIFIAQQN